MRFLNKSGREYSFVAIAIVALIAYMVWSGGSTQTTGGTPQTPTAPSNTVQIVGAPCTQGTTLTSSMIRRHTDATLGSENVTVVQNGVEKTTINSGGTTTVQSGPNADMLDLYPAFQSTTYYAQHVQGKLSTCTSSATTGDANAFKFMQDESPGGTRVVYSDHPNKVVFIADGVTIDIVNDGQADAQGGGLNEGTGGFENLTIGQGSSGSVALKFKVDYNEGWGVIGGNILACQFPSSVYDATKPLSPTVNGVALEETSVKPSNQQFPLIQSNNTVKAFKFPGIDGRLTPVVDASVILRADQNHNPDRTLDRVNCTAFDTGYYKQQSTGKYLLDTENRDTNADLGGANTIFDFVIGVE